MNTIDQEIAMLASKALSSPRLQASPKETEESQALMEQDCLSNHGLSSVEIEALVEKIQADMKARGATREFHQIGQQEVLFILADE